MSLDMIKNKMNSLREQQEKTQDENETLKGEIKSLSEKITGQEHEIKSLLNNNNLLEKELQEAQGPIAEAKATANDCTKLREENENLRGKLGKLEAEADTVDKQVRDLSEKLRDKEVQFGYAEQKIQSLQKKQSEEDEKYEDLRKTYNTVRKELEDFQQEIGNI